MKPRVGRDYTILSLDFDKKLVWDGVFFSSPMRGCIGASSDGISLSLVTCRVKCYTKKVWFMFVLWSVLMVSGCSGKQTEDMERNVVSEVEISEMDVAEDLEADISLEADTDVIGNSDASMETEQTEISETEELSGDVSNLETSTSKEPIVDDTTKEIMRQRRKMGVW